MTRRPNLVLQLSVAFTCAALVPLLLLAYSQVRAWHEAGSERAERETMLSSTSLAHEIGGLLDARAEAVRALTAEVAAHPTLEPVATEAMVERFLRASPGFYTVGVADPQGKAIAAALSDASGYHAVYGSSYADRDYVHRLQAGADFAVSDMLRSKLTGKPAIILAARVLDRDQRLRALVIAGIDLALLERAMDRVHRVAPGLSSVIVDHAGNVVASDGSTGLKVLDSVDQQGFFARPRGLEPERRVGELHGERLRGVVALVQSNLVSWSVICSWPEELVKARGRIVTETTLAFAIGALVLGLGLALVLARRIAGPIEKLAALVSAIGRGDLRVRPEAPDFWFSEELRALSAAVEDTLSRLHSLLQQIAQTALALSDVMRKLNAESANLVRESREQQQAVTHGSGAIVEMADSMASVSSGTRDLSLVASETSASLSSLDQQIAQIAGSILVLTETIDAASHEVFEMGREVDSTVQTATELASHVASTTAAVDELADSVERVTSGAAHSEKLAQEAILAAGAGQAAVEATIGANLQIEESFGRVQVAVEGLASRSEAIGDVVRVIDEVTRATQLLAINASIIASQAGEHGKSFGIVADRVKELAQETAASTREIESLIESVQTDIAHAVQAVTHGQETVLLGRHRSDEAGRRLQLIIDGSSQAEQQVREIASAMHEHAEGLRTVRAAISDMNGLTRRMDLATAAQRQAQQGMTQAIERVHNVGRQVEESTAAQTAASHAIAEAVRSMTERLRAVAAASQSQHAGRARIEHSLGTFQGASHTSVERAHQIDAVAAGLRTRLAELERQLKAFRFD